MGDHRSGEGEGEGLCARSTSRWPFLARSAVALVVTVLAAIVVGRAVLLMLHPKMLQLKIAPSNVYAQRYKLAGENGDDDANAYVFRFYLEAVNPSERAFVYYSNITVQFDDDKGQLIAKFNLTPSSISLSQQEQQEYVVHGIAWQRQGGVANDIDQRLFDKNDEKINFVLMRLDGLVRENAEGATTPNRASTYNCQPLAIINTNKLPEPSSDNHQGNCVPAVL